jgi:hypothetical protein
MAELIQRELRAQMIHAQGGKACPSRRWRDMRRNRVLPLATLTKLATDGRGVISLDAMRQAIHAATDAMLEAVYHEPPRAA